MNFDRERPKEDENVDHDHAVPPLTPRVAAIFLPCGHVERQINSKEQTLRIDMLSDDSLWPGLACSDMSGISLSRGAVLK